MSDSHPGIRSDDRPDGIPRAGDELELSRLFEITNDAFAIASPDGFFRRVNAAWTRLLGWTLEELTTKPFIEFVHPGDREQTLAEFAAIIEQGKQTFGFINRYRHRDGSYRTIEWTASRAPDTGYVYATARDVSERTRADGRLRGVVESAPNAIVLVDRGGAITLVNAQAEALFGYSRGELVGKPIEILVPIRFRDNHPTLRDGFFADPGTRAMGAGRDLHGRHKDGREIPVEVGLNPIDTEEGTLVLGSIIDITGRKAVEAALRAARAEAERANLAKSELLSRMSHELRTPLNAVLGFAQLLEMDTLTKDQLENVHYISRAGRHLLELINEVLDISRIEAGQMTLSPEPVAVADLLTEVMGLIAPLADGRSVTLDASTAGCEVHVLADRQRLRQVLLNLLANAVKYNREGGSVTVACAGVDGDRLRISVIDTGHGIPSDQLDRLFLPFERLGADRSAVEGTGMGLALSKGLIEAMGGRIGVGSELDRGTTFWVEFALVEGPLEAYEHGRRAVAPSVAPSPGRTRKLLHIEDNLSNLKLVERILVHRPDIELISAMRGDLGTKLAREHRPDLILLDLHLPDAPGSKILRRLRSHPETRHIPIVIISADATKTQIARLTDEGAAGYLTKPLDVNAFFKLVDRLLEDR